MALGFASFTMHRSYGVGFNQSSPLFHWHVQFQWEAETKEHSLRCEVCCSWTQGLSKRSTFDRPCAALAWTLVRSSRYSSNSNDFQTNSSSSSIFLLQWFFSSSLLVFLLCTFIETFICFSFRFSFCFSRPFPGDGQSPGRSEAAYPGSSALTAHRCSQFVRRRRLAEMTAGGRSNILDPARQDQSSLEKTTRLKWLKSY